MKKMKSSTKTLAAKAILIAMALILNSVVTTTAFASTSYPEWSGQPYTPHFAGVFSHVRSAKIYHEGLNTFMLIAANVGDPTAQMDIYRSDFDGTTWSPPYVLTQFSSATQNDWDTAIDFAANKIYISTSDGGALKVCNWTGEPSCATQLGTASTNPRAIFLDSANNLMYFGHSGGAAMRYHTDLSSWTWEAITSLTLSTVLGLHLGPTYALVTNKCDAGAGFICGTGVGFQAYTYIYLDGGAALPLSSRWSIVPGSSLLIPHPEPRNIRGVTVDSATGTLWYVANDTNDLNPVIYSVQPACGDDYCLGSDDCEADCCPAATCSGQGCTAYNAAHPCTCTPTCTDTCSPDDGCGSFCNGTCPLAPSDSCVDGNTLRQYNASTCDLGTCNEHYTEMTCTYGCASGACQSCVPTCAGKDCGADNGCGESCMTGICPLAPSDYCVDGNTLRQYNASTCDLGICNEHYTEMTCTYGCASGACQSCVPDCAGKECGDDGCGGSCGTCTLPETCDGTGCICTPDTCITLAYACGPIVNDGCGGSVSSCGTCGPGYDCIDHGCVHTGTCGDDVCDDTETCMGCPEDCMLDLPSNVELSGNCTLTYCDGTQPWTVQNVSGLTCTVKVNLVGGTPAEILIENFCIDGACAASQLACLGDAHHCDIVYGNITVHDNGQHPAITPVDGGCDTGISGTIYRLVRYMTGGDVIFEASCTEGHIWYTFHFDSGDTTIHLGPTTVDCPDCVDEATVNITEETVETPDPPDGDPDGGDTDGGDAGDTDDDGGEVIDGGDADDDAGHPDGDTECANGETDQDGGSQPGDCDSDGDSSSDDGPETDIDQGHGGGGGGCSCSLADSNSPSSILLLLGIILAIMCIRPWRKRT